MLALELIDPKVGLTIIHWGGWALLVSGVLHLVVWLIGELRPSIYDRFKAKIVRKLFTGASNRIMFGAAGLLLVFIGGAAIILGKILANAYLITS